MIKITDKSKCSGCHACYTVCPQRCISMVKDQEGFLYPQIDETKCIQCRKCLDACPILVNKPLKDNYPKAYACFNKREIDRQKSSSGGIFSLLCEKVIDEGGVIFAVEFDENFMTKHSFFTKEKDIEKYRGSKYLQSVIGESFRETKKNLELGRQVLFTGTPCQIAGLKMFLGKEYSNLMTHDIVCHGVPSPKIWEKYLNYQQTKAHSEVKNVSFRDKSQGWENYHVTINFNNGQQYKSPYHKDKFMNLFLRNYSLRPSCYACHFKTLHRQSDLTLADFWGINHVLPTMNDDKGTSLLLVNTEKGAEMLEKIRTNIQIEEVDVNEAIKFNGSAIRSSSRPSDREKFIRRIDRFSLNKLAKKYGEDSFLKRFIRKGKRTLLKIRRKLIK